MDEFQTLTIRVEHVGGVVVRVIVEVGGRLAFLGHPVTLADA